MLTALSTTALTSCGSDDDDDNNNNNNGGGGSSITGNNSSLVKDGNILLTSITDNKDQETYTFEYDELLRPISSLLTTSSYQEYYYLIDYKSGKFGYGLENQNYTVSFNSMGYITKVQGSYKDEDYSVSMSMTYNYDNSGHIISSEGTAETNESYNGVTHYEKTIAKGTATWENGNLIKLETYDTEYDKSGKVIESNLLTETFTYGNTANRYRQFFRILDDDQLLFMTGLQGVGPEKLPQTHQSLEIAEYNGHKDTYSYSYTSEFTLNADGSINTEKWTDSNNGQTYIDAQYNYTPVNEYKASGTRAAVTRMNSTSVNKGKRIKKFMRKALFMPTGRH